MLLTVNEIYLDVWMYLYEYYILCLKLQSYFEIWYYWFLYISSCI